jgi:restriction system protein
MFSLMVHGIKSPLTMPPREDGGKKPEPAEVSSLDRGPTDPYEGSAVFSLEKYLQEFIVSNWNKTPLATKLDIYIEGEEEAVEFNTGIDEIDILARDRSTGDWVVIELKKGHESDRVVGQLMRYMGWIRRHKAGVGEKVRGIIITGLTDDRIKYAIAAIEGFEFFTYKVSFDLVEEKVE